jgi:hypothetical protein
VRGPAAEISRVLMTAIAGFAAAKSETSRLAGTGARCEIWTGRWGCGAFGGNRELMAISQLAAAEFAGIERLVFAAVDDPGVRDFEHARGRWDGLRRKTVGDSARALIERLDAQAYEWGVSDGN